MTSQFMGRLRAWRSRSLANAFTLSAVLIAMLSSLLVALISLTVIYYWEQSTQTERLQVKSARLAEKVRDTIGILETTVIEISTSPVFTSALLDSRGRATYVIPYLENYKFPVATVTGIALCDINGDKLASMRSPISNCEGASAAYKAAIQSGSATRELVKTQAGTLAWVLYQPVKHPYAEFAAGAVVAQLDLNDLLQPLPKDLELQNASLLRLDNSQVLVSANAVAGTAGAAPGRPSAAMTPLFKDAVQRLAFPVGVVAKQNYLMFDGKLLPLFIAYLMGSVVLVLGIVKVVRRASAQLIAPLTNLTLAANHIARSGDLAVAIPQAETGEVGALGLAMYHMVQTLRASEATLESKIELRTSELKISQEKAQAASLSKSQFLANMSHEIRTPMNAILGMLTLLRKTELSTRQTDYAAKSEGAARALLGLLNDILDFSKIEAGRMSLDPHPFGMDHMLADLSVLLSTNAGDKPVKVLFDIDPALPRSLLGDSMRLQQVLLNLGSNAIKFTPQGEVVLSIRVLQRADAAVTLQFSMRDNGIGIAPENQARIFSGFTQAEASTTRRFGGTGLGVAISQRFVSMMGGELELQSELGVGSRFFFTVTLPVAAQADERETQRHSVAAPALQHRLQGMRLLLVEDNLNNQQVARELLEDEGASVQIANNGQEAVEAVASADPGFDVVLMDLQMPVMDGFAATRIIRTDMGRTSLPIVAVTANAMASDREDCLAAGMSDHIGKPFDLNELVRVLRKQAQWGEADASSAAPRQADIAQSQDVQRAASHAGVDLAAALQRLGGKQDVYGRMLQMFVRDLAAMPVQLKSDTPDAARRMLHTLKGLSATLGATLLCAGAAKAEMRIGASPGAEQVALAVGQACKDIEAALPGLQALLDVFQRDALAARAGAADHTVQALDRPALVMALQNLAALLHAQDMDALAAMVRLQQQFGQALGDDIVALDAAVSELALDQALPLCNSLLQKYVGEDVQTA